MPTVSNRSAGAGRAGALAGAVATVAWLLGAALLAAQIVVHGVHTHAATAGELAMLALSLLWFLLAVARVPVREATGAEATSGREEPPA